MEIHKIGKAIKELRLRAGYTQAELAAYLEVTDKAVSRWECCLGIPDVSLLPKLCNLLNTDIESLLEGNTNYLEPDWRGVLLLQKNDAQILPETRIHGKCSVYLPLSYFLLAGIREITVAGDPVYLESAKRVLGSGSRFGIVLSYCREEKEAFMDSCPAMIVGSDVFLYGPHLTRYFQIALSGSGGQASCLAVQAAKEEDRVYFTPERRIQTHCQMRVKYNRVPIWFYSDPTKWLTDADSRGREVRMVEPLDRGMIYRRIQTWKDVDAVSAFLGFVEENTGESVYCPEEIAYNRGMITRTQLHQAADPETAYGRYLLSL